MSSLTHFKEVVAYLGRSQKYLCYDLPKYSLKAFYL